MSLNSLPTSNDSFLLEMSYVPCFVCYHHGGSSNAVKMRSCCSGFLCTDCLRCHIETKINQAVVKIVCPLEECDSFIPEEEIQELASEELYEKYMKFQIDMAQNPNVKSCPNCSKIFTFETKEKPETETEEEVEAQNKNKLGKKKLSDESKVICTDCHLVWCFECQAPWHYGMTCKDFCKGDRSLKIWAKNKGNYSRNATRCPKCQIFIQKSAGCDHMICSRYASVGFAFFGL